MMLLKIVQEHGILHHYLLLDFKALLLHVSRIIRLNADSILKSLGHPLLLVLVVMVL